MQNASAKGPLFIVSMWRAGSSLLYALLNQHPQVGLTYEADLRLLTPVFWKPTALRDWPERWEFWNSALSRHKIIPASLDATASFQTAFETAHQGYAAAKGAEIWGDKSPNYYDRMTWLARRFPGSSFIVVWRNPIDTARSMVRAAATGNTYFQKRGIKLRSLLGYRVLFRQHQALLRAGVPVHALNYEDLISDTRATMEGVCEFLGIPFDPRVLTLENADRSAIYDEEHHTLVKRDAIVVSTGRPEVLEAEWQAKVGRYVRLWQQQEAGWPAYPKLATTEMEDPAATATPTSERLFDSLQYFLWRLFDQFTAVVYTFAPLALLKRYRAKGTESPAAVGTTKVKLDKSASR
jgi:hypothetical protein